MPLPAAFSARLAAQHEQTAAIIEDVEWMRDSGESPSIMATRLHTTVEALEKRLLRAGRPDLAAIFWRERQRAA